MYTVASPDPNPRGEGQLPNPNEGNSTLTSGTNNIYPNSYIDINDRGRRFRSGSPLTNYPHANTSLSINSVEILEFCLVYGGTIPLATTVQIFAFI